MKIENWSFRRVSSPENEGEAPENLPLSVVGAVYGNSKFNDGERICTSPVLEIFGDSINPYQAIQTRTDKYELGEMDEAFKKFLEENSKNISDNTPIV